MSRTFGDAEPKFEKFGGMKEVLIAEPEITVVKISDEHDFIVLGCNLKLCR